jgi:PIN domain nuclease of toxin-antitoxin system
MASLWEIAQKLNNKGFNFRLPANWHEVLPMELTLLGAERLDITPECLHKLQTLPFHHRDPFDRMIISQALTYKAADGLIGCELHSYQHY